MDDRTALAPPISSEHTALSSVCSVLPPSSQSDREKTSAEGGRSRAKLIHNPYKKRRTVAPPPSAPLSLPSPTGGSDDRTGGAARVTVIRNPYKKRQSTQSSRGAAMGTPNLRRLRAKRLFSRQDTDTHPPANLPRSNPSSTSQQPSSQRTAVTLSPDFPTTDDQVLLSPTSVTDDVCETSLVPFKSLKGSSDVFFALLLQNGIQELVHAAIVGDNDQAGMVAAENLLAKLCQKADLPVPVERLQAKYDTAREHLESRAALVLEEARFKLCRDLYNLKIEAQKPSFEIEMEVEEDDDYQSEFSSPMKRQQTVPSVSFRRLHYEKGWFTAGEKSCLIPGLILLCVSHESEQEFLGVLSLRSNPSITTQQGILDVEFFVRPEAFSPTSRWTLYPVGSTHINTARAFAAVTEEYPLVPFFDTIRCAELSEDRASTDTTDSNASTTEARVTSEQLSSPVLNESQRNAANSFLSSANGTVTTVQGPPGTGKTTFCVGVICDYLLKAKRDGRKHRILVCAPTNKAISHIALRFLECIHKDQGHCLNIIALGNEDKLESGSNTRGFPFNVKSIHLYSWIRTVAQEYDRLAKDSVSDHVGLAKRADLLRRRLRSSLGQLPSNVEKLMDSVCQKLEGTVIADSGGTSPLDEDVRKLVRSIQQLDQTNVLSSLLNSADVIFSTLSMARSKKAMFTNKVDCLIIDEAAAATEPALYIPLHLQPSKMLVVGDPRQLPAIVESPIAERFGLSESLHERLMGRLCSKNHFLLDTQYRMRPEISFFPSRAFYAGSVKNGNNVQSLDYGTATPLLFDGRSYIFLQVQGEAVTSDVPRSPCNREEAYAIVRLLLRMRSQQDGSEWKSDHNVRVLSFYKGQVALIRSLLQQAGLTSISVGTVDSSQGCESNTVIVSFVKGSRTAGFLKDDRRINVALTRARHQLVCVGNVEAMRFLHERDAATLRRISFDAFQRRAVLKESQARRSTM